MNRLVMLRHLVLFASLGLAIPGLGACSDDCESNGECATGEVCAAGACVAAPAGTGTFTPADVGPADLGPDGGGPDIGDVGDTGAEDGGDSGVRDGGDAGPQDTGPGTLVGSTEADVWVDGFRLIAQRLEVGALLEDRPAGSVSVSTMTFPDCTLTTIRPLGATTPLQLSGVQVSGFLGGTVALNVQSGSSWSPSTSLSIGALPQSGSLLFSVLAAPSGAADPALTAAEVSVPVPLSPAITSPSATGVNLALPLTVSWVASVPGSIVVIELVVDDPASPNLESKLRCLVPDLGSYLVPSEAVRAFSAVRGSYEAVLRVFRERNAVREVATLAGGTRTVTFRVRAGDEIPVL